MDVGYLYGKIPRDGEIGKEYQEHKLFLTEILFLCICVLVKMLSYLFVLDFCMTFCIRDSIYNYCNP